MCQGISIKDIFFTKISKRNFALKIDTYYDKLIKEHKREERK